MQATFRRRVAVGFCPLANIGQVFENQGAPRGTALGEVFGKGVVTIPPESGLRVPEAAQVPPGAFGATRLQRPFEPEVASVGSFPGFFTEELVRRGYSGMCQSKINADDLIGLRYDRRLDRHDNMQPPSPIRVLEQV
jgi:hypothetical protein